MQILLLIIVDNLRNKANISLIISLLKKNILDFSSGMVFEGEQGRLIRFPQQYSAGLRLNVFIYVIKIVVKPYKSAEFEDAMRSISHNFPNEKGCLGYSVNRDTANKNTFMAIGEWKTRQSMDQHFQTQEFELFIGAARVLGETFEMNFAEVLKTGGFELAREQVHRIN